MNGTSSDATAIAIVGIGCQFPRAPDKQAFWANVRDGVDAIGEIPPTHFAVDDYFDPDPKAPDRIYVRRGGFLEPVAFDALRWGIAPRDLEATDTTQLLGLMVAQAALDDADYGPGRRPLPHERTSVILGVTGALELVIPLGARLGHPLWRRALRDAGVDDATAEDVVARIAAGYVPWQENSFPGLLGNVAAGRIANRLDLHGTNCVVDAACASSLSAVHLGILELESGRSDVVLCGGIDTFNDIFMYMCFSKTPALSPTGDARPFDADGDGTILGEGVGLVVLKRLADAEADGDRIYAVLRGMGTSSDGKGAAIYAPVAEGQARALRRAYAQAGVSPRDVDLVEAHGTGTKVGDGIELAALHEVYGAAEGRAWCALGSVKSMIGHTKAAAGAAGLIKAALAVYHRTLPPTLKVRQPAAPLRGERTPFYLTTQPRPWWSGGRPRRAAVSAFGFGGSNFHGVLEQYGDGCRDIDWDGRVEIFAFGADDPQALARAIETCAVASDGRDLAGVAAASRASFDPAAPHRCVWVLRQGEDFAARREAACRAVLGAAPAPRRDVFYGHGPAPRLAVLFPGQGAQRVGMLRDLAVRCPALLDALEAAGPDIATRIYPPARFDPDAAADEERTLRRTDIAQPALGAVEWGAWRLLADWGLRPVAAAGHSFGELVALAAAGRLPAEALPGLAAARGRIMATRTTDDPGTMLAVSMPLPALARWCSEHAPALVLANRNAPRQGVLSGPTDAIDAAERRLRTEGVACTRLQVGAAFHAPGMAPAVAAWSDALARIPWSPGEGTVYANASASPYPEDPDAARAELARQLAAPVDFVGTIERMVADGVEAFLEIGPGRRLAGLVRAIVPERPVVSLEASEGREPGFLDLARTLAELAAWGHPIDLRAWENPREPRDRRCPPAAPKVAISICGANLKVAGATGGASRSSSPTAAETTRPASLGAGPAAPASSGATPSWEVSGAPTIDTRPPSPFHAELPMTDRPVRSPSTPPVAASADAVLALVELQRQTAELHRQFLEGQAEATRMFERLLTGTSEVGASSAPYVSAEAPRSASRAWIEPAPSDVAGRAEISERTQPAGVSEARAQGPSVAAEGTGGMPSAPPVGSRETPADVPQRSPTSPHDAAVDPVDLAAVVLRVVAEKTGYPTEMLSLSMGLDADLGIDSIKRVEILAALQEALPACPVVGAEAIADLRTLADVITVLSGAAPAAVAEPELARPAPTPASPADVEPVYATLAAIVAEKTGYPIAMLDASMTLDADLGIDSIKRVEIFAALQEALPDRPALTAEQTTELRTLADVAGALADGPTSAPPSPNLSRPASSGLVTASPRRDRTPSSGPQTSQASTTFPATATPAAPSSGPSASISAHAASPPAASSEADGLASSASQAESAPTLDLWFPLPAPWSPPPAVVAPSGPWLVLGHDPAERAAWSALLASAGADVRAADALEDGPALAGCVLLSLRDPAAEVTALRDLLPRFAAEAIVASVTRLDGTFGLTAAPTSDAPDPDEGRLAGLLKTLQHEAPTLRVRALDLDPTLDLTSRGEDVLQLLLADGPVERGLDGAGRTWTLDLGQDLSAAPDAPVWQPAADDVVVVSGGARGVTAAAAEALARAGAGTLVLLGRTPAPEDEPAWLRALEDEAAIKATLLQHGGVEATPRAVQVACAEVMAGREIRRTLERLGQTGARVAYRAVDLRDAAAVRHVLDEVRETFGPVTALVHGAGVLADARLADKRPEDVTRVYATKVAGLEHLLAALDPTKLRAVALFSSSTARFGRRGQSDYAMANEALNKRAQRLARTLPHARVLAVNWGPWDGGMVTPGLRRLFAEEGITTIPLEAGARRLLDLLATPGPVEVVVLGAGSVRPQPAAPSAPAWSRVVNRSVRLGEHAVLEDHVLDGRAVLPVALAIEWMAHAALHDLPGLELLGIEDLQVLRGVRCTAEDALQLEFAAGPPLPAVGELEGTFAVSTELREAGAPTASQRARMIVGARPTERPAPRGPMPQEPGTPSPYEHGDLFHGPQWHALRSVGEVSSTGVWGWCEPAPRPDHWMRHPVRRRWIADPWAIDAGLQLVILWSLRRLSAPCLPNGWGRYRQYCSAFGPGPVAVAVQVTDHGPGRLRCDVEWLDADGQLLARLEDLRSTVDPGLRPAFARSRLRRAPDLRVDGSL